MTPFARTAGSRRARLLSAPRALKAPTVCRFSALSHSSAPASSSRAGQRTTGVRTTWPASRAAAATTSARWTGKVTVVRSARVLPRPARFARDCLPRAVALSLPLLHLLLQLLEVDAGRQALRHALV